jgi:hypothetical protein
VSVPVPLFICVCLFLFVGVDYVLPNDLSTRIAPLNTHTTNWRADLYEGCLLEVKCNEDLINQKWMWGRVLTLHVPTNTRTHTATRRNDGEDGDDDGADEDDGAWLEVAYQFANEPTIIKRVDLYGETICPLGMHTKDRSRLNANNIIPDLQHTHNNNNNHRRQPPHLQSIANTHPRRVHDMESEQLIEQAKRNMVMSARTQDGNYEEDEGHMVGTGEDGCDGVFVDIEDAFDEEMLPNGDADESDDVEDDYSEDEEGEDAIAAAGGNDEGSGVGLMRAGKKVHSMSAHTTNTPPQGLLSLSSARSSAGRQAAPTHTNTLGTPPSALRTLIATTPNSTNLSTPTRPPAVGRAHTQQQLLGSGLGLGPGLGSNGRTRANTPVVFIEDTHTPTPAHTNTPSSSHVLLALPTPRTPSMMSVRSTSAATNTHTPRTNTANTSRTTTPNTLTNLSSSPARSSPARGTANVCAPDCLDDIAEFVFTRLVNII